MYVTFTFLFEVSIPALVCVDVDGTKIYDVTERCSRMRRLIIALVLGIAAFVLAEGGHRLRTMFLCSARHSLTQRTNNHSAIVACASRMISFASFSKRLETTYWTDVNWWHDGWHVTLKKKITCACRWKERVNFTPSPGKFESDDATYMLLCNLP